MNFILYPFQPNQPFNLVHLINVLPQVMQRRQGIDPGRFDELIQIHPLINLVRHLSVTGTHRYDGNIF